MTFLLPSTLCLRKLPYREFKKLQRLLHRKRPIEIERSVRLSALRLFNDGGVVQSWRTAPSFAWQLRACVVARTSNMKISRRCLADYVNKFHQKACRTCSPTIFPCSTNQLNHLNDLWCCDCLCFVIS